MKYNKHMENREAFDMEKRFIAQRLLADKKLSVQDLVFYFGFTREEAEDLDAAVDIFKEHSSIK